MFTWPEQGDVLYVVLQGDYGLEVESTTVKAVHEDGTIQLAAWVNRYTACRTPAEAFKAFATQRRDEAARARYEANRLDDLATMAEARAKREESR